MTTITRERLLKIQQWRETYGAGSNVMLPAEEAEELARIALASLDADPVSQPYKLPEEKGASLQLRNLIRKRHAEWSDSTFGNVGPVGPLKHLSKEALEAAAEPGDLSEWADMQFLLWDAQRRAGITDEQIALAMVEKLAVNKKREWPEPKDGEPRLHIKEQSAPVIPDGWISCSERMPDDGRHVIILCDGAFVLYAQYRDGEFFDIVRNGDEFFETQSRNVNDWMPLPEPPQQ